MAKADTIGALIAAGDDAAAAIGAPERTPLDYASLRQHLVETVASLNGLGLGRGDRIAIVLPNGPEMAGAFLALAAGATTAPLNPAYRAQEFEFYLSDLGAKALVVEAGSDSVAIEVARSHGIAVLEMVRGEKAGAFTLGGAAVGEARDSGFAEAGDVALVLHTSGTTGRPKIVPLSHANLCASAGNVGRTLALSSADRCLNVMPLFHIHGLVAAVLASLGAGASVHCTPGFNALKFFTWMEAVRPTWYTAVPTMHQAILTRAGRGTNPDTIREVALRLIRSSSSSLPPQVMAELEAAFGAPVIESYGMTEAAHQMTSNPMPPAARKPGTVGVPAGPEVATMDGQGALLAVGEIGEIVIRGANVTAGYENNPAANAEAFAAGWFRTGDQGRLDAEGYLTVTGRIKEIINRGGEKISPREVDEVMMDHPAVGQAVAFAVPHPKLGEDVAAAIVLREGMNAGERDIREFVATRLAPFKVPRKVVIVEDIPKGATGKVQRARLAEVLGLTE
jgi:acyl-CoA synthetase (AMP-forming)/AMP-acid ligase II